MARAKFAFPVSWASVTFGDSVVGLGFSMSRGDLTPDELDELLTGKRLTCKLFAGVPVTPGAESNGQKRAFTDGDHEVHAVFDSKGFGVRAKKFTGTISTMIADIDPATISQFAKRDGRIEIGKIEELDPADDEEEEDDKPARKPRARKTAEPTPADETA